MLRRENFHHFLDCVPVSIGSWHAQELLDFAEVTDRLHLPAIETQNESILDRNDLKQPVFLRGQREGNSRRCRWPFGQHIHEADYIFAGRLSRERIRCCDLDEIARGNNHDLAFERQLLRDRSAKSGSIHVFAHNKRADSADVDHAELRQLFCDYCRLTAIRCPDVDRAKKDNPFHKLIVDV